MVYEIFTNYNPIITLTVKIVNILSTQKIVKITLFSAKMHCFRNDFGI